MGARLAFHRSQSMSHRPLRFGSSAGMLRLLKGVGTHTDSPHLQPDNVKRHLPVAPETRRADVYDRPQSHCHAGMVGVINPTADKTFAMFQVSLTIPFTTSSCPAHCPKRPLGRRHKLFGDQRFVVRAPLQHWCCVCARGNANWKERRDASERWCRWPADAPQRRCRRHTLSRVS